MKYLITIILSLFSLNFVTARGGGGHGGGHSSSHSSSHSTSHSTSHASGHTTTHHISHGSHSTSAKTTRSYTKVTHIEPTQIHRHNTGGSNHFLYYYLLFNHNTHTHDTIQSNTYADLQTQVTEISDEDDSPMSNTTIIIIIIGFVLLGIAFYLSFIR